MDFYHAETSDDRGPEPTGSASSTRCFCCPDLFASPATQPLGELPNLSGQHPRCLVHQLWMKITSEEQSNRELWVSCQLGSTPK